ncbi:hypothetical protein COU57_02940 [Candidatus Pacearchaeota archaeon CG10_big_fil_rev_8_21_14_0_10_32_14]|nr:MAG: hypothetical protein COU57_02940 [Candidatus Pacearchaeota archaeon CG10_big_fil_rev_8_21_14_0_10_32_14]
MQEHTFTKKLFNSEIEILVYDLDFAKAKKIVDASYKEALRLQNIFNFYDKKSELSKLNSKRKLKVSDELLFVIKDAISMYDLTLGRYDITLGKQILKRKSGQELSSHNTSVKDMIIDGNKITLNHPDIMIDLGSIAKGYITDKISDFLKSKGITEFLIDSRGDIIVSGKLNHQLGIQHPRDKDKVLCNVNLQDIAIATSGDYNQFYNSYENSHILNAQDIISVSVISPTLTLADVLSTALFVSDESQRKKIISENKHASVILVHKGLKVEYYNNFDKFIVKDGLHN